MAAGTISSISQSVNGWVSCAPMPLVGVGLVSGIPVGTILNVREHAWSLEHTNYMQLEHCPVAA